MAIRSSVRRTQTFAVATLFFSLACTDLPATSAPLPPSTSGAAGGTGGGGGMASPSGGKAGAPGPGGSDSGGTSSGMGAGSGGSAARGGNAGAGGKAGAGNAGQGGGAGEGGETEVGEGGMGAAPMGGSAGVFSTNRDAFFGEPRCRDDLDLCEDFESGAFDDALWEVAGSEHPSVDDTRAARGDYSAHFHTVDNGLSMIRTRAIFPASNNSYFGRMFVYFDSMPTAPANAHWTVSGAQGPDDEEFEIRVGGQYDGSTNRFGVGSDHGPTGDWTNKDEDPGDPVPVREWVCLEWMHRGDSHETRFYWDGVEHPSLYTSATDHGGDQAEDYDLPSFESVWFGWWLYQADTVPGEFDVWIDEIALDAERIGCDN